MQFLFAASLLLAAPAPGDGLGLTPGPGSAEPVPGAATPAPRVPGVPSPLRVGALLSVSATLVGVGAARRGTRDGSDGPGVPPDVLLVVVPGFDSPAHGTFDELARRIGIPADRVMEFDWRWVEADHDHVGASRRGASDDAADVLEGYLGGLAATGSRMYLVGHSKGGTAIAEMISRWDDAPERAVDGVIGAALLEPPMARGLLGRAQRHRWWVLPNNGGFDPIECGWLSCRDRREGLGDAAGVDVLVVRNPDAGVTSFRDHPDDLRVYDLEDDGGQPAMVRVFTEGSVLGRIVEAHDAPLHHPAVAACISAELHTLGTCEWTAGAIHDGEHEPAIPMGFRGAGGATGKRVI
ncbi:MAG: hypothetical protein ACE5GC_10935 [Acidimicrobiia bacterium]